MISWYQINKSFIIILIIHFQKKKEKKKMFAVKYTSVKSRGIIIRQ